jgi:hypothetical protein
MALRELLIRIIPLNITLTREDHMFDGNLSRRGFIAGAGALAAGAAYAQLSGLPSAEAKGQSDQRWPYKAQPIDTGRDLLWQEQSRKQAQNVT